ncbi:transmembrane protein, putative (macronuclear) [Tetrahymena thermophila SB210]|uniref:Transmembrane protein, putative n=1 Tax=Tetrahymena thermophila (strain SB210) TaxID=312017 RepID=Q23MM5_TETTS|nr:transmembrane protein, putative [Tetrahymena thermophila SB210]EAR97817.2 transmembrane protein, putative [Tetrahymena thermophila SB210]|eukprot:XP_001018062.2 transmembrane protein, putative [Tetrahymena thermophila SB210]
MNERTKGQEIINLQFQKKGTWLYFFISFFNQLNIFTYPQYQLVNLISNILNKQINNLASKHRSQFIERCLQIDQLLYRCKSKNIHQQLRMKSSKINSQKSQEYKDENLTTLNTEQSAHNHTQKRQSVKNSTLKSQQKIGDSSKPIISTKTNIENFSGNSATIGQNHSGSQNAASFQPSKTFSIMSRIFQKQGNNASSNVKSRVNFDSKTQVNFIQKQHSLKKIDLHTDSIMRDPLVNVFPEGMPRKHILYKELLQAYFNGDITMNELIDLRNKYTMKRERVVSLPLKDDEQQLQQLNEKQDQKANKKLWEQIRQLRQKQLNKFKNNEKRAQRSSIVINSPGGMILMRADSIQSGGLQSQNSFSQATLSRQDTKQDIGMEQIDEKEENQKFYEDEITQKNSNSQSDQQGVKKITKFGSIIFDKLLNIKDKVEHKKVIQMKQNKQNQNQFLTQFEEAQQEVIEKIKRGDLLQNDLSHKYYVKQFIERKNLNHLKILADKTAQIESLVTAKTVKKMNEDFKANKHKIFKEIENAADEYLNKLQLKRNLLELFSQSNTNKYEELEQLKNWRQQNSKKILKEQQEKHMHQYQFEKEQKELEQEIKKQRLLQSRLMRNSMDNISNTNSKQENSSSVENIKNNYFTSAQRLQSNSLSYNKNFSLQQPSIIGQFLKKEMSSPSIFTQQRNLNSINTQNGYGIINNINPKSLSIPFSNQNNINFNQNTTNSTILHVSRTSMTDYNSILGNTTNIGKQAQITQSYQNQKPHRTNILQRKQTDGLLTAKGGQRYIEDYMNINGTASSTATTSNSNKINNLFSPQKNKGFHLPQNISQIGPYGQKVVDLDHKNNNQKQTSESKRKNYQKNEVDQLSKSALIEQSKQDDQQNQKQKENQKITINYLNKSKIINEHNKQNKQTIFLKDLYDLYSQEELYRNTNQLRTRSKMLVSDKENLQNFYKSEYEYKIIKRNANSQTDRQNSFYKTEGDKSVSTLAIPEIKQNRVKSESNCLNSTNMNKQNYYQIQGHNQNEDSLIEKSNSQNFNNMKNNNNNLDDSESGDSSLPSITEAQLDSYYSQSKHIQKMILKTKGNTQLFARRMKNVIKLKEINEGINKCTKMKLNHKSIKNY